MIEPHRLSFTYNWFIITVYPITKGKVNIVKISNIQWEDTINIRHKVLWPDKAPMFCKVEGDEQAEHYGVFINGSLVSVASVYRQDNSARLRKFATLENHQGQGVGSRLLQHMLNEAKKNHVNYFWCDARKTAINFYQKFGMQPEGDEFYKSGLPYYKMGIKLCPE